MNVAVMPNSATENDFAIGTSDRPQGLPDNWSYVPLRSVCEKTSIWNPVREPRDHFRYIDVSAVSNEHFCVTGTQEIAGPSAPSRARKIVKARDVIYATVRPSLKRVAQIEPHYDDQIASTAFCIVRADPKQAVSKFLYYILLSDDVNRRIIEHERGASYPAVTDKDVLNQFVPLPPIDEQDKIAAVLWKIQKAVEIEDAIVRNARDLKKSLLRRLFTHGLRGSDSIELDSRKVPAHWRSCRFRDFATLHRGYDLPVQDRLAGTVPIVGSNGIVGYHSIAKLKGPGVATGRSGTMGLSFYIECDYWPLNTALYVEHFHSNNPLFVHYFFQCFDFERYSAGVSVPTLNRNLVHEAVVAIPDPDEQREIADILQTVDRKIDTHQSKKRSLRDLFKTMLHKLMTAQIRVNDLDIDTSEVNG